MSGLSRTRLLGSQSLKQEDPAQSTGGKLRLWSWASALMQAATGTGAVAMLSGREKPPQATVNALAVKI